VTPQPPPRPTVVVAVHDGHYGAGTGAGLDNRAFLRVLTANLTPGIRLVICPVYLCPRSPEHDHTWHDETIRLLAQVDATIQPVDNGTGGMYRFGGLAHFRRTSAEVASLLEQVATAADPLAVILFDVPFLGVPPLVSRQVTATITAVPRSTALQHDPSDTERVGFERQGLLATTRHGGHIASTSKHMHHHLLADYGVPEHSLIGLTNGLVDDDWRFGPPDQAILPRLADGFLLSIGRAVPYKGWDDLIDALTILRSHQINCPHAILAAVTETPEPSHYQNHLAHRIHTAGLKATLLTRFSSHIRNLLAHPALRGVIVASRAEPFGRIPLEAYAAGAAPLVTTTAGGLQEQVIDGVTAITTPPSDPPQLAQAIRRALAMTPTQRQDMRRAGRQLLATHFDHNQAVHAFFRRIAPWALSTPSASTTPHALTQM
jgi:glycosyltransferase involved in cell wall biosynthesis